jgi:formiminotetrahydrofolate cyclodeaminase
MKRVKTYRSFKEMEQEDKAYWKTASMEKRELARDALLKNYCLFKGIDLDAQGFTRILRVVKYPQS